MIRISGKIIQNAYDETTDVFNLLDSYSTILKSENTFMKHYYRYKKPFFEFTYTAGLENDSNLKLKNGFHKPYTDTTQSDACNN